MININSYEQLQYFLTIHKTRSKQSLNYFLSQIYNNLLNIYINLQTAAL